MQKNEPKFRFNRKLAFLTYSTGTTAPDLTLDELREYLEGLSEHIGYLVVSREICPKTHNVHFHALIEFDLAPDIKSRERLLCKGYGV